MQGFDRRHLAARLGLLEAVGQQHQASVDPLHPRMHRQDNTHPAACEGIPAQGGAMEEIQQATVAGRLEPEGTHQAGDPAQIPSHRHGGQGHGKPQKGALTRARSTQLQDERPPMGPQEHI